MTGAQRSAFGDFRMSIDGTYHFVYGGAADVGIGAFVIENGQIRGADYGGGRYSGTARELSDGRIEVQITFTVMPGMALVQGVAPQDLPYNKSINQTFPPLFGDGAPIPTSTPPVTVMIKRVPDGTSLAAALKVK